jgi:2-dehydro-3-deoxyphosphogluconate aldolase/(4S)-4-hydroxy-2-oxoglutarate aldolase
MKTIEILTRRPVIPVMVIDRLDDALPLAEALIEGGLDVLEITLRTGVALQAIQQIKQAFPEAIVGSGTVIDQETYQASKDVGVDFMVSPGMTENLLQIASTENVNLLPGAATPSEAMRLLEAGFTCQKFFPAEAAGGIQMLKSIASPLPQITFCPTGGISPSNAASYLALSNVACVGGSWMLDKELINQKKWQQITATCAELIRTL